MELPDAPANVNLPAICNPEDPCRTVDIEVVTPMTFELFIYVTALGN